MNKKDTPGPFRARHRTGRIARFVALQGNMVMLLLPWSWADWQTGRKAPASSNLAENVPDPDRDQHGCHRVIADERLDLIMGLARLIDLPLNRLADELWRDCPGPLRVTILRAGGKRVIAADAA
jgi:hypothetical protein